MKRLEDLPQIANRQLGGLEATPTLLAKIKLRAAEESAPRRPRMKLKPILSACAALIICVGAVWSLTSPSASVEGPQPTENVLKSLSAGDVAMETVAPDTTAEVPVGAITMGSGRSSTAGTLFAEATGASFPLITLNNATYRMLQSPAALSPNLLGASLGMVTEFTIEPALSSGGVISNTVAVGESVYVVDGMGGALVAANVDGSMRLFQRVSYAGTAIIGQETLADTLCVPEDVAAISLDGLTVSDQADAQALMQILIDNAEYENTSMSGAGSLQITLKSGLTLQLLTGDDAVSACGTWSCPDFFEAFHEAVGQ